jgi:hypothetical protein
MLVHPNVLNDNQGQRYLENEVERLLTTWHTRILEIIFLGSMVLLERPS